MTDILIVASPGGHLKVAEELFLNTDLKIKFITTRNNPDQIFKYDAIREFNRDMNIFRAFYDAFLVIKKNKPKIIVSTGAGVAVPFFILGYLMHKKLIFIESISRVKSLSLAGKIVYPFVKKLYVRNIELTYIYKKAEYYG